jgi:integrase/recombinase XerD
MKLYPTAATVYVNESGKLRTPASIASFRKVMRLLQSQYPAKHLADFTSEDLTSFCLSRGAAPSTIKNRRAHCRSFFEWCTWRKLVAANPASDLKFTVQPGNFGVREGNWLTETQVSAIARSFGDDVQGRRDRIVFLFGVMCGLRAFEIAGLTWDAFTSDLASFQLVGKGNKLARQGVPAQLRKELATWRASLPLGAKAVIPRSRQVWSPATHRREVVWCWDEPLGYDGIRHAVRTAADRAAVGCDLAPHDLRRTFAGILEGKGVSVQDISRALRHANVGITSTYLEKNPAKAVAVTAGLELDL